MKRVFADSFFYLAFLSPRDAANAHAMKIAGQPGLTTLTTAWVLTEILDALSDNYTRIRAVTFVFNLYQNPFTEILPPSTKLLEKGLELYRTRPDKDWSLTDCISFVAMEEHGITEALTADKHFEQAGFAALLKE